MKSEYRNFDAIFVGLAERSDMLVVLDEHSVHRIVSVKLPSKELRSDPAFLEQIEGFALKTETSGAGCQRDSF